MNKQNFLQIGGFPLEADTLDKMQTAYELFNALGELAGNKAIIQGCVAAGGSTSDGVVYLNGEVFEFKGGPTQSTVRIIEVPTSKEFENGDINEAHYERYVTFASGSGSIPWSDFKKFESLLTLSGRMLPAGTNPQLYCGSVANIPTGWQLCDGTNGTPNLKGRFIVGYDPADEDYDAIGNTGGEKEHELTIAETPAHDHGGSTSINGAHTHTQSIKLYHEEGLPIASGNGDVASGHAANFEQNVIWTNNPSGDHMHNISSEGGGEAHENRPPYYTLAYIIFIGS